MIRTIPLIIGRQLRPPSGWEYELFERLGWNFIGGTCLSEYREKVAVEKEELIEGRETPGYAKHRYDIQIPLERDLSKGFLWLHHHTHPSRVMRFIKKIKKILLPDDRLLVIATIPTKETRDVFGAIEEGLPKGIYRGIYICSQDYSRGSYCMTPTAFGRWYSRGDERILMGRFAEKTIFVLYIKGGIADCFDIWKKPWTIWTEEMVMNLSTVASIRSCECVESDKVMKSIVDFGREKDPLFMKGVEL